MRAICAKLLCASASTIAVIDREVMGYLLARACLRNPAGRLAFHPHSAGRARSCGCAFATARLQPILAAMQAHRLPAAQLRAGQRDYLRQLAEQRWSPDAPYCSNIREESFPRRI